MTLPGWIADHLNPILVREVNQALNGRSFLWTGALSLGAVLLIALAIAARGSGAAYGGSEAFHTTMMVLAPLLLLVVPFQTFLSMRQEVTSGTVEHLLLSKLGPGAIVRGKLAAATVQFLLYLSVFAPLLGLTFLLRGVDVPTIALAVVLGFLFGLAACSLGVACGALARWPGVMRVFPWLVMVVGLGGVTLWVMSMLSLSMSGWRAFFDVGGRFWEMVVSGGGPLLAVVVVCAMTGTSVLAHPYENRSTRFRVFAFAFVVLGFLWHLLLLTMESGLRSSAPALFIDLPVWAPGFAAWCAALLFLFPLCATTEEEALTPRVRNHVPRSAFLAFLATPFLPGRGRGLLFTLLLASAALLGAAFVPRWFGMGPADFVEFGTAKLAWAYVILYAGLLCFMRRFLPRGERGNWLGRSFAILLLLLAVVGPTLLEVIFAGYVKSGWRWTQLFNPFATISHFDGSPQAPARILSTVSAMATGAVLLNGFALLRGIAEVQLASRRRRSLAP